MLGATLVVIVIITVTFHNRKIMLHMAILESAPTPTGYILMPRTKEKAAGIPKQEKKTDSARPPCVAA